MTNKQSGTFINGRGQTLYTVEFVPVKPPKALLIFHHGYGEHTGRYDYGRQHILPQAAMCRPYQISRPLSVTLSAAVAHGSSTDGQFLRSQVKTDRMFCRAVFGEIAKAGIAVHSYDCHGHGRSEPLEERDRALIWHFHHVVQLSGFPPSLLLACAHLPACCKCHWAEPEMRCHGALCLHLTLASICTPSGLRVGLRSEQCSEGSSVCLLKTWAEGICHCRGFNPG